MEACSSGEVGVGVTGPVKFVLGLRVGGCWVLGVLDFRSDTCRALEKGV